MYQCKVNICFYAVFFFQTICENISILMKWLHNANDAKQKAAKVKLLNVFIIKHDWTRSFSNIK